MLYFPRTTVVQFFRARNSQPTPGMRLGQEFYTFFQLDRVESVDGREVADRIFNGTATEVNRIVNDHTDWNS